MPLVVGVDSSTQSTKVEVRELDTGRVVATGSAKHPPTSPPVSEQDPRGVVGRVRVGVGQLGDRREVVAICVAGQQHGLVLLDEHRRRPSGRPSCGTTPSPRREAERLVLELGTGGNGRR